MLRRAEAPNPTPGFHEILRILKAPHSHPTSLSASQKSSMVLPEKPLLALIAALWYPSQSLITHSRLFSGPPT